jgi:signal transduction histidine kinase
MLETLTTWLQQNSKRLCDGTLTDTPNVLVDGREIDEFIRLIANTAQQSVPDQLYAMQKWAVRQTGSDSMAANDWLLIIRVLKQQTLLALTKAFDPTAVLQEWSAVDGVFTYALIEVAKLTSSSDNALMLEHMVSLRRQMEELDRSKSRFIQVAAHELKTPLTLLEGYANMIRTSVPEDDLLMQMYLAGLDGGTFRLREIVGDMIDLSMIESGVIKITRQPLYVDKVVTQVVKSFVQPFADRRVELVLEPFVPIPGPIYADPERLLQVFSKIISNGLKYTPDGGRVTVRAVRVREEEKSESVDGYVDVQISDTGIGIAPENLERIFASFDMMGEVANHSSGKTKFKGGGPGLGLPIARGIVEAHGGRIWAESKGFDERKRPGSTFHIELPCRIKLSAGAE